MARKKLIWQLFPSYLLVIVLALLAITLYTTRTVKSFYREQLIQTLERHARLLQPQVLDHLQNAHYDALDGLVKSMSTDMELRITVILPDGEVIADTDQALENILNHANRPEVITAFQGFIGVKERYSNTIHADMTYVALPLEQEGILIGVLRTAYPMVALQRNLRAILLQVFLGGAVITVLAGLVCWLVSKRLIRPITELKLGAQRFARGDLQQTLPLPDSEEIAELTEAMNQMAQQLNERLKTLMRQRNEQEAVLSSMVESVFAIDRQERIISMNQAAANFFDVAPHNISLKPLHEVIRNSALQQFVTDALHSEAPLERELTLYHKGEQFLQAGGAVLKDSLGRRVGVVIVLNDITRLRRLEKVRRDFVANVSHELKTPITSIIGFVETLRDGALQDGETAQRFLEIIDQQAERLNRIIEDLLLLSRMEQEHESAESLLSRSPINTTLKTAVQLCQSTAEKKHIQITREESPEINAYINSSLLEQGIVNLLNNAIKYSEPGSRVILRTLQSDKEIRIEVHDEGCGIAPEHLPRLFERFYRVDKDRSRRQGGTGLGLAIVKHIAQLHRGYVTVKSTLGAGSCFRIHLPQA